MRMRRGYTLVEVLLWMVLLGTVFAMAYPAFGEALALHRQARICAEQVDAGLRLFKDLRADLREAREVRPGPAGSLQVLLPAGAVAYRQVEGAVERGVEGGGVRRYPGLEGLEVGWGSPLRVFWSLTPVRKGVAPPRFEVAHAR